MLNIDSPLALFDTSIEHNIKIKNYQTISGRSNDIVVVPYLINNRVS